MRSVFVLSLFAISLVACSQALVIEKPRTIVADNAGLECKRGTPTGTIRTHKVCTTAAQREQQRQAAEVGMDQRRQDEQQEAMRHVFRTDRPRP